MSSCIDRSEEVHICVRVPAGTAMEDALHEMKEMIGKDIRDKHKAMIRRENAKSLRAKFSPIALKMRAE